MNTEPERVMVSPTAAPPECTLPEKQWCAWCGVWGDHTSGRCDNLVRRACDDWRCGWQGTSATVLRAPDPFNEGDELIACPKCRCQTIRTCCDEPGCWEEATCGTPTPSGYRRTCGPHHPSAKLTTAGTTTPARLPEPADTQRNTGTLMEQSCAESADTLEQLRAENAKLRGIIARNALQRLRGEAATELHVTASDIKESLEILYAWLAANG